MPCHRQEVYADILEDGSQVAGGARRGGGRDVWSALQLRHGIDAALNDLPQKEGVALRLRYGLEGRAHTCGEARPRKL